MLRLIPLLFAFTLIAPQTPAPVDFAGLDAVVRKEMQDMSTPGAAIAVIQGDRVILARGFGVANTETGEAVRPEMVFRLGSTTKMFTAAAVVLLAQQGKLNLDEPIGRHLPGLTPKLAALTANQLLSHTSGILDEAPMFGSHDDGALKREVAGWKDDRFFTEPGKIYSYSNPGYWLAGLLAETAGGKPFADQVASTIFAPVGMSRSTFRPTVAMTYALAQGHDLVAGKPQIIRPAADNAASWPAGSIYTSVMDVSRWMIAFVNGGQLGGAQVLPASVFTAMSTPHATIPGSPSRYGYGVSIGTWRGLAMVEHGGSRSGYGSIIRMVPSQKFGVVVLANRSGVSLARTAAFAIEAALKPEPAAAPPSRAPMAMTAAEAAAYAGVYSQGSRQTELVAKGAELFHKRAAGDLKLEKIGADELQGGTVRYVVVRGSSGAVEYLHAGGRSWRRVQSQSQSPTGTAKPAFENGQAQIVPAFADATTWIRHRLWVETEFDSDGDRKRDRVHVDVTRQRQTDTEGLKVPVIYESSPYFAGTSGDPKFLWNVKQEVGAEPPARQSQPEIAFKAERASISNSQTATWVPRGFAIVHSEAPGTGLSQGCATVGGAPERLAPKAVIDWLNGRAKGFTSADGNEEVKATWTTGKVGMTGTSYNGTIPLAAATTGVEGLEAIIPIAPNTSYYHYYRSHGLVRHPGGWLGEDIDFLYDFVNSGDPARRAICNKTYRDGQFTEGRDRRTGDYNAFWVERDLLPYVGNVKAATLMAHAFNDWNVVPEHSVRISNALKGRVPLQQYFHQGGHGGAPPMELMNKWFTRYLYGVQNGVENDPKAWIVRETPPPPVPPAGTAPAPPTGRGRGNTPAPTPYADYPNPAASPVTLQLTAGGSSRGQLVAGPVAGKRGMEKLIDNVEFPAPALALAGESVHRLLYATAELTEGVHISGTVQVTLRLASSKPAANLSVYLVQLPWMEGPIGTANLITRGWADPQNHKALTGGGDFHSRERGTPLKPGEFVTMTFDLQPDDQIVPAGKRIGLMIFSSDRDFTLWPQPGTELTIDLDATRLRLPVVGGAAAFGRATGGR